VTMRDASRLPSEARVCFAVAATRLILCTYAVHDFRVARHGLYFATAAPPRTSIATSMLPRVAFEYGQRS
jgi:hypothetical protein